MGKVREACPGSSSTRSQIKPGRSKMAGTMTENPLPNPEEKAQKTASKKPLPQVMNIPLSS